MKKTIGAVALLVATLMVLGTVYIAVRAPISTALGDCKSLGTYSREKISNQGDENYLKQEIRVCQGEDIDESEEPAGEDGEEPSEEATPTATATVTVTSDPTATPTVTVTAQPTATTTVTKTMTAEATPEPEVRQWEYLANRPPVTKSSYNAFAPLEGLAIDKRLDDRSITSDEGMIELRHHLQIDPMVSSATGAALELWSYDEVDVKTELFANDHNAWDQANAQIERKLDKAVEDGTVKIVELRGHYTASWAIPGSVPSVRTDMDVWRNGQLALSVDGTLLQLQCGFQEYWKQAEEGKTAAPEGTTPMPEPSPGMTRDKETGTPKKIVTTTTTTARATETATATTTATATETATSTATATTTATATETATSTATATTTATATETATSTATATTTATATQTATSTTTPKTTPTAEVGAPQASETRPPRASADPVVTETTGGGGVVDNPTNPPGDESGVTAPGADPAPTTTAAAAPTATGASDPDESGECVPDRGQTSC